MTVKNMTIREKTVALLNDETVSTYRIAKDAGQWNNAVVALRYGRSDVSNIRLGAAEKYAELYDVIQKERANK